MQSLGDRETSTQIAAGVVNVLKMASNRACSRRVISKILKVYIICAPQQPWSDAVVGTIWRAGYMEQA